MQHLPGDHGEDGRLAHRERLRDGGRQHAAIGKPAAAEEPDGEVEADRPAGEGQMPLRGPWEGWRRLSSLGGHLTVRRAEKATTEPRRRFQRCRPPPLPVAPGPDLGLPGAQPGVLALVSLLGESSPRANAALSSRSACSIVVGLAHRLSSEPRDANPPRSRTRARSPCGQIGKPKPLPKIQVAVGFDCVGGSRLHRSPTLPSRDTRPPLPTAGFVFSG